MAQAYHSFPTLYKKTSTGAIQEWTISVLGTCIITIYGQSGGKMQRAEDVIKEGKNIGRSNETTPEQQALSEAASKWEKQIKKGYVEDVSRAAEGDKDIEGGYDCMLAHKFSDHAHKINYPAYVQPKLDGHRCLAVIENGKCTLWSRTRKPITSMPHIVKELENVYPKGTHRLDGELYNHSYKDNFEDITSLIRQEEPDPRHTEVQYHVYDRPAESGFSERTEKLYNEIHAYEKATKKLDYIRVVETVKVDSEEEMMLAFEHFLLRGFEGAMARNSDGPYMGKRSYDLQKIKEFVDAEFPVVGVTEGRGKLMGHAIFICKTPEGKEFNVKMRGDSAVLKKYFDDDSLWKGKQLTVKYQKVSKYNIPIFPVGERFKDEL